jgi:hypothetical protein
MAGRKQTKGKVPLHLISDPAIEGIARVMEFGMNGKPDGYEARNWEQGLQYSDVYSAMKRHAAKWWCGHNDDSESGLNHMFHVACLAMFLAHFEACYEQYASFDDRPTHHKDGISNDQFVNDKLCQGTVTVTTGRDQEAFIQYLKDNADAFKAVLGELGGTNE